MVPKTHFSPDWTEEKVTEAVESAFPNIKTSPSPLLKVQKVVDQWAATVDLSGKPIVVKNTNKEKARKKDDILYRSQLRGLTRAATKKDAQPADRVTFTHAWNYYLSINMLKHGEGGRRAAKAKIAEMWNVLPVEEKEECRKAYAALLEEGKDIYRGRIVTIEEKRRKSPKKKTSKKKLDKKEDTD